MSSGLRFTLANFKFILNCTFSVFVFSTTPISLLLFLSGDSVSRFSFGSVQLFCAIVKRMHPQWAFLTQWMRFIFNEKYLFEIVFYFCAAFRLRNVYSRLCLRYNCFTSSINATESDGSFVFLFHFSLSLFEFLPCPITIVELFYKNANYRIDTLNLFIYTEDEDYVTKDVDFQWFFSRRQKLWNNHSSVLSAVSYDQRIFGVVQGNS